MRNLLVGAVMGAAAVLAAEFLFLTQGGLPVAARGARAMPLEEFMASRALHVAIAAEAKRPAPIPADEANLLAGARLYLEHCEVCHGSPGTDRRSAIGRGLFPPPPHLMPPEKGVSDDPVGETYWKVKNGIRLTGMPGFEGALSETQLWQVSLLVSRSDRLPPSVVATIH